MRGSMNLTALLMRSLGIHSSLFITLTWSWGSRIVVIPPFRRSWRLGPGRRFWGDDGFKDCVGRGTDSVLL